MLKRLPLKHNIIERDRILIPPNWDSWGKIRVLREGFDAEAVSSGWSRDIQPAKQPLESNKHEIYSELGSQSHQLDSSISEAGDGPLSAYEDTISNPKKETALEELTASKSRLAKMETMDMQEFLAGQLEVMERLKAQDEQGTDHKDDKGVPSPSSKRKDPGNGDSKTRVNEHIGPVQFNMGGIQVDADDMLQRLKDREREETPDRESSAAATPDGKTQNEALANFFAGLIKRGGNNSPKPPAT